MVSSTAFSFTYWSTNFAAATVRQMNHKIVKINDKRYVLVTPANKMTATKKMIVTQLAIGRAHV